MELGKVIACEREKLNLSQRALARRAGIRQATLSSIESGGEVKIGTARNILLALGMELEASPVKVSRGTALAEARQAEIARIRTHFEKRRNNLRSLLESLPAGQIRKVREINEKTNTGYLAKLWDDFLLLDKSSMQKALATERFHDMAWQSLLQANPFIVARVGTWD